MNDPRFVHLLTLRYDDLIPFIFEYLKKRTFPVISACLFTGASFIWLIITGLAMIGKYSAGQIFLHSLVGFVVIPLLLILPHELLHVIPYRLSGATDIRIGAKPAQFYFYVTAHRHVTGRGGFIWVALLPFCIISIFFMVMMAMASPLWLWSLAGAFFLHNTMCAGDLALLNFYYLNRKRELYNWDDIEKNETYFYCIQQ